MAHALETALLHVLDTETRMSPTGPLCGISRMMQRHPELSWRSMGCPLGVLRAFARRHPDVIARAAATGGAEARTLRAYQDTVARHGKDVLLEDCGILSGTKD